MNRQFLCVMVNIPQAEARAKAAHFLRKGDFLESRFSLATRFAVMSSPQYRFMERLRFYMPSVHQIRWNALFH